MPSKGKIKGSKFERDWAEFLTENGIPSKRQVLSGSHPDHKGDVKSTDGTIYELKNRESISKTLWEWIEPVDYLVVKRNHHKPLVVMTAEQFVKLMKGCLPKE